MIALVIVLCLLALLCLLLLLPVMARFIYDEKGFSLYFSCGPIAVPVDGDKLMEKWKGSREKKKKAEKTEQEPEKASEKQENKAEIFLSIVKTMGKVLSKLRKKIKINHIEVNYIAAAADPCDAAMAYGAAWAILGTLRGALENVFLLKKANFDVQADFDAKKPSLVVSGVASVSLGSLVWLMIFAFFGFVKEFLKK